jgi:UDP-N-acetylmuramoyl-tripeptide--D-alanyl-D-alanine ligase
MKSTNVHPAANNSDAIAVLLGLIQPGDIVLVKGSRGLAMESIVDALAETAGSKN